MPGNATDNVHEVSFFGPSENSLIDPIMFGFKYAAEDDGTTEVTFSIPGEGAIFNDEYIIEGNEVTDSFFPVTDQMADWFREAADFISNITNLSLTEVAEDGVQFGEIRLAGTNDLPDNLGAGVFGDAEDFHLNRTGDIFFDDRALGFDETYLQRVVIHELGHAIGLAHPGEGFGAAFEMPAEFNGDEYTVMDTNFASAFFADATWADKFPSTYMYADILAMQHMYGANENANSGDDTYSFNISDDNFMTIYDLGGKDTIEITGTNGSAEADSVVINLGTPDDSLGGHFIDVGTTVTYFNDASEIVGTRDKTVYVSPESMIENITTVGGNDVIVGNDFANVIKSGDGDDVISAEAGDDTIVGGDGDDIIAAGDGNDIVWAGSGDTGNDIVSGDNGNDIIAGGGGADILAGGSGIDIIFGGSGDDIVVGHGWNDGSPTMDETASNQLWAGEGDDQVYGANGADKLGGGLGDDTIGGGDGNDVLYGGKSGDDKLSGGAGSDVMFGGTDNDILSGDSGNDELYGGVGFDLIDGGVGADTLYGGAGDDTLDGGTGNDIYRAGDGADILIFDDRHGDDTVSSFEVGTDILDLSGTVDTFTNTSSVEANAQNTTVGGEAGLLIDTGDGNSIFLIGLGTDDIASMDFIF
ncbi:MAG: hypothetical protein HWE25_07615 [Alphaproteobacteria bacterium]|nr:hypothetical protein [Alphaproteobacteria bacterium]